MSFEDDFGFKKRTALVSISAFFGFIVVVAFFGFGMDSFFRPAYRKLDNKVFKESEQYNDGMIRDLENLKMDYIKADDQGKQALKAVILHRFSVYPKDKMSADLQNFYEGLQK